MNQNSGECIPYKDIVKPKTKQELLDKNNYVNIKYRFASLYLKDFLDASKKQYGSIKTGLMIILANKPPNYDEILNSNLYFSRLK
jgi:hypothetical protein